MLPVGISALISILFLKSRFNKSLDASFIKYLIITLLILRLDYAIYFFLNSFIEQSFNYHFLLHSVFVGLLVFAFLRFFSEHRKSAYLKRISQAVLSGFLLSILAALLFSLISINHFWPIIDKDLNFSILSNLFFNANQIENLILIYFALELISLIVYGRFLVLKLVSNKSSAIDIKRVLKSIKFQKYLFIIFLIIFFVIYNMNLQSINFYITAISLFYLFVITINIYVTFKTSFNI